mgnify:FL=1
MEIKSDSILYQRIETAIRNNFENSSDSLEQTLQTFSNDCQNFAGNPLHVQRLLDFMQTDNVYEAVNNLHLRNIQIRLKDQAEVIVSKSGHKMTQQAYQFINRKDPSGQTYDCGIELAVSLFQTFGNGEQKGIYVDQKLKKEIKKRNKKTQPQSLEDVISNLEELEDNPNLINQVTNPNVRRQLKDYLRLNSELKKLILAIDELSYGNTATLEPRRAHFSLSADYGGAVMKWLKRKISDDPNSVPEEITEAYTNLNSEYLDLSTVERRLLFSALCKYEATERTVNAKVALGNYIDDLEYLLDLSAEDSFIKKYGKPDLSRVRSVLEESGEIRKIDLPQIFNIPQVARIRESANSDYENMFGDDLEVAKETFRSLFMDGDYWKDDSKKSSVPMGRLKKSTFFATLMQKDFDVVKNYLLMDTLTPDKKRRYKSHSIKQFKGVVEGTVKAVRKVMHLEAVLEGFGVNVNDHAQGYATVNCFQNQMLRGQNYELVEHFEDEQEISLAEVIIRADISKRDFKQWKNGSLKLKELEQLGLYDSKTIAEVQPIIDEMKTLIPYTDDLKEAFKELIDYFSNHDDVVELNNLRLPVDTQPYLHPTGINDLAGLVEAKEELEKRAEESPEIIVQRNELSQATFYSGAIRAGRIMVDVNKNIIPQKDYGAIILVDNEKVEEHLNTIAADYVRVSDLPQGWLTKAQHLTSFKAAEELNKAGLETSYAGTWKIMQNVSNRDYLHKDLIEMVEKL